MTITSPSTIYIAFLKVRVLRALRHRACLDTLLSMQHLPRENPSDLHNLLRYIAIPSRLKNVTFLPCVKFFEFCSPYVFSMLFLCFRR